MKVRLTDVFYQSQRNFNFFDLLQAELLTDLTLVTTDGIKTPVHRSILALGSPYFYKMLTTSQNEEYKMDCIELKDNITKPFLNIILEFIYTGSVSFEVEEAEEVFIRAQYLQIKTMINFCSEIIEKNLNKKNLRHLFAFSIKYLAHDIQNKCAQLFCENSDELYDIFLLNLKEKELNFFIKNPKYFESIKNQEKLLLNLSTWAEKQIKEREDRKYYLDQFLNILDFSSISNNISHRIYSNNKLLSWKKKTPIMVLEKYLSLIHNQGVETLDFCLKKWKNKLYFGKRFDWGFSSTFFKNNIFISGGESFGTATNAFEAFNVSYRKFQECSKMIVSRRHHNIIAFDGKVYALGGFGNEGTTNYYDLTTNKWYTSGNLNKEKHCFGVVSKDENVMYVFGGRTDDNKFSDSVEMFDAREGVWQKIYDMPDDTFDLCKALNFGENMVFCSKVWGSGNLFELRSRNWIIKVPRSCYASKVFNWSRFDVANFNENIYSFSQYFNDNSDVPIFKTFQYKPIENIWEYSNFCEPSIVDSSTLTFNIHEFS